MYATVADLRAEQLEVPLESEARVNSLLDAASMQIDRVTGSFFEPRALTLRLSGRDAPTVYPPHPPIRIDELWIWDQRLELDDVEVVGAPIRSWSDGPRITRLRGVFPDGRSNVRVVGAFGDVETDAAGTPRVPLAIRRATMLLALRWLPLLRDADGSAGRRIVSERTRDQMVTYSDGGIGERPLTDDAEVDALLWPYVRTSAMGAV